VTKNILLDLDGTLTDPREGIVRCIQHALHTLGRESPDASELERYIGPPLGRSFQELLGTTDSELVADALSAYRARFTSEGLFENRVYPEIPHALEALCRAGRMLYLVTVKPRVFAQRILDHFQLAAHLRAVYAPELTELLPDKTSLVASTLSREGLDPASACMVGDRADDMLAARKNGIRTLAVTWGYGSRAELESAGPDFIVDSVPELLACMGIA
jgi:phosphoglycolate phosphatase